MQWVVNNSKSASILFGLFGQAGHIGPVSHRGLFSSWRPAARSPTQGFVGPESFRESFTLMPVWVFMSLGAIIGRSIAYALIVY